MFLFREFSPSKLLLGRDRDELVQNKLYSTELSIKYGKKVWCSMKKL